MTNHIQTAQTLLKRMLQSASNFKDYNVRSYLVRKTNDAYASFAKEKGGELNETSAKAFSEFAEKELRWMERQEKVYELYGSERKSVLDGDDDGKR